MKFIHLTIITMAALLLSACDDTLSSTLKRYDTMINVTLPDDAVSGTITHETYTFKNVSSGRVSVESGAIAKLLPGLYDISYEAMLETTDHRAFRLRAFKQSCIITEGYNTIDLQATCIIDNDDLTISEIFFTGTLQPSGISYNGDDYVKLYNNTDHVVYADGLTLFESKFSTTEKNAYTPDIMAEAMTVQALYTIPGSGKEHPVNPGCYLLLVDTGIDHRTANPNSIDLSNADFEWYDVSSTPSNLDIDSPTVPNLDKWYCYTRSYWILHNRGFKAYGIARIPVEKATYLKDYYYSYDYEIVTAAGTYPMTGQAYRLTNEWIIDVVNCSVASDYAWNVCAPALDCGWTSCGTISNDKTRFGKAVRRKLLYVTDDGRAVLKDTNNSTEDFNASVTPSEFETIKTYDGVTPIAE